MGFVIPAPALPSVAVEGTTDRFPVRRIFCVGRNYAEHAREMGMDDREPPFFFTKPADAVVDCGVDSGTSIPFPPLTANLHHEVRRSLAPGQAQRLAIPAQPLNVILQSVPGPHHESSNACGSKSSRLYLTSATG